MNTEWKKSAVCEHFFDGRDRKTGKNKWTGSPPTSCSVQARNSEPSRKFMRVTMRRRSSCVTSWLLEQGDGILIALTCGQIGRIRRKRFVEEPLT